MCLSRDSSAAHGERAGCPLQSVEVTSGADAHLQPVEDPMQRQVAVPEEDRDSEGSSQLLGGLKPMEGTHAGAEEECEESSPSGGRSSRDDM